MANENEKTATTQSIPFLKTLKKVTLLIAIIQTIALIPGCNKEETNPSDHKQFVGGPENPASDETYTSRIYSENGIASLEEISLGDEMQWILIRGYDISKPVIIFLHGGPGSAGIFYSTYAFGGLENDFVVVTWDQRGSGKSYNENIDPGSLTFEQLYSDTHELIVKMIERFGVEKVFLMGLSWGSILGINIAYDYPELLHAYLGVGQVVDMERAVEIAYDKVFEKANFLENQTAILELTPIPQDSLWEYHNIISKWVEAFGFGDFHNESKAEQFRDELASSLTEYSLKDITNLDNGKILYDLSPLGSDLSWLIIINMETQISYLEVPVYFLAGEFDYKTPSLLVNEYCQSLNTDVGKKIIWFENSAHIPILEERELFHDKMINMVLVEIAGLIN